MIDDPKNSKKFQTAPYSSYLFLILYFNSFFFFIFPTKKILKIDRVFLDEKSSPI